MPAGNGNELIRYIGPRRDGIGSYQNRGRIFDNRGPNINAGEDAVNTLESRNYNDYYKTQPYVDYIIASMGHLNNNV